MDNIFHGFICYTKIGGNENYPNDLNILVNFHYHDENRVITWYFPSMHAPTIVVNSNLSTATSIAHPLLHLIRCCKTRHRHRKFLKIQQLQLDLTQGFRKDSAQVFPVWFGSRFSTVFDSTFPDSIRTKVFDWIHVPSLCDTE